MPPSSNSCSTRASRRAAISTACCEPPRSRRIWRRMMRIKAALLCAALAAAPLQAQATATTADDARAVIAAVLAHQASIRGPEGGAETCVAQALGGPPGAPGAAAEDDSLAPDHAVRIYFQWHVPDAP